MRKPEKLSDEDIIEEGDGTVHIVPLEGREHVFSADCWCHPVQDDEKPELYIHNVEQ